MAALGQLESCFLLRLHTEETQGPSVGCAVCVLGHRCHNNAVIAWPCHSVTLTCQVLPALNRRQRCALSELSFLISSQWEQTDQLGVMLEVMLTWGLGFCCLLCGQTRIFSSSQNLLILNPGHLIAPLNSEGDVITCRAHTS